MAFGSLGTIWAEIGLETRKLQAGVTTARTQLSTLDRQAMTQTASINAKLSKIGAGLAVVGKNMTRYVTLPLMAVGAASVKAGMDFDSSMTKSLAIMNNVTPRIRAQLEQTAKAVVDYTTFSAKEAADAYFYLSSAGLDAAQSMEALPRVAKFAQAGQFDLALATDLLTDAQSALGLSIKDDVVANMENMTRVSDVLVKANTLANATVRQFSESLTNKAGAALKLLNKDVEEGVAVLAAWADQGVKGTEAGNYLNIVLRDLQSAAIKNEEVFDRYNISVFDTTGNMRGMADVVSDLEVALDGMSDKEKRATLMMLGFQDRSISAMMTLLGTSEAIREYEKDLRSATGFTEKVAAKQMESFTAQVEQLKNELILVGIEIFDILRPRLEGLIEQVKRGIDWFDKLTVSQKNLVVNMGIFVAAVGPVAYALKGLITIVVALRTAIVAVGVATKITYFEIFAVAAILVLLAKRLGEVTNKFIDGTYAAMGWKEQIRDILNLPEPSTFFPEEKVYEPGTIVRLEDLVSEVGEANKTVEYGQRVIKNYGDELPNVSARLTKLIRDFQDGTLGAEDFAIEVDDLKEATHSWRIDIEELSPEIEEGTEYTGRWTEAVYGYAGAINYAERYTGRWTEKVYGYAGAIHYATDETRTAKQSVDDYRQSLIDQGYTEEKVTELTESYANSLGYVIDAEGNLEKATDDTTGAIKDQREEVEKLRSEFNDLIDDIFGHIITYDDYQEAIWAVEDAEKAVAAAVKEYGIDSREAEEERIKLNDANIEAIRIGFELSTSVNATTEQQEEGRKKAIELGLQYMATGKIGAAEFVRLAAEFGMSTADILEYAEQNNIDLKALYKDATDAGIGNFIELTVGAGLSLDDMVKLADEAGIDIKGYLHDVADSGIENFVELLTGFGLSSGQIVDLADTMGIHIDTATRVRLLELDASSVPGTVEEVKKELDKIPDETTKKLTLKTFYKRYYSPGYEEWLGAKGGIIKAMASGGIIGSDGTRLPMLTAAYGMVTPQRGRVVPVLAHEGEVILNTSQQKNIAEWIMNKASTSPNYNTPNYNIPIQIRNIIELDGQVIYEKTSEYLYDRQKVEGRGIGIK